MTLNPAKALQRLAGQANRRAVTAEAIEERRQLIAKRIKSMGFDDMEPLNHHKLSKYLARLVLDDADKGLFISGNPGTGKTFAAMLLMDYTRRKYAEPGFVTAMGFVQMANKEGIHDAIKQFTTDLKTADWTQFKERGVWDGRTFKFCDLLVDDLASESNAVHMGVRSEAIPELIHARYDMFKSYGCRTHFTSNIAFEKMEGLYGKRIESRLEEMCYITKFAGDDRRKQQKRG